GEYKDLDPYNDTVYAFTRTHGEKRYLVVINCKDNKVNNRLPGQLSIRQTLSESSASQRVADNAHELLIQPWQSGIYRLN
ncbi:alpha-glucosidase C-terminal domain-containing protein, partial [Erwinia amylovora]|uniref:alpha-glucosidase C-terminal domain-containing protein n=1 Tax=Erwinia amylovora TaxID=552 RepID=UPI0020BDA2CB